MIKTKTTKTEDELMKQLQQDVFKQMSALEKDDYLLNKLRQFVKNRNKKWINKKIEMNNPYNP